MVIVKKSIRFIFRAGKGTFSALQGHAKVGLNHRDGKACDSALKSLTLLQ